MNIVQFPNLFGGFEFELPTVALNLFGKLPIYWYGIIIAFGFMLAVILAMRDSKKFGLEPENIIDLVLWAAPIAIVFARVYYVIFSWEEFKYEPIKVFYLREGGIAIYGALIGAFLTAFIFCKIKKIRPLTLLDLCIPFVAMAQAIGRWGNFFNQEAFGTNTSLPWGMKSDRTIRYLQNSQELLQSHGISVDPQSPVHPTFLYESIWNLGVFALLMFLRKKKKVEGEIFFLYLALYGLGRVWIEGMRTDSLWWGNLRFSQVLAGLSVIIFSVIIYMRRRKANEIQLELEAAGVESTYKEIMNEIKSENEDNAYTVQNERKFNFKIEEFEKEDLVDVQEGEKDKE